MARILLIGHLGSQLFVLAAATAVRLAISLISVFFWYHSHVYDNGGA